MNEAATPTPRSERWLTWILYAIGVGDLLAVSAAFLPDAALTRAHEALGIGALPDAPIVGYLARSASLMYALHGAVVIYVARSLRQHWDFVRFLAVIAYVHGLLIIVVDCIEALPLWWIVGEGAFYLASATLILLLQRTADKARTKAEQGAQELADLG